MSADLKTNVMRVLDSHKIVYKHYSYDSTVATTGGEIAQMLNQDPAQVFKTLVTVSKNNRYYVFMVPVCEELDLKKAALAVGEKAIDMLKQRDLLPLTGYVHGGCSPIGMKKQFRTVIDESAKNFDTIIFSAGKVGHQVETTLADLQKIVPVTFSYICL